METPLSHRTRCLVVALLLQFTSVWAFAQTARIDHVAATQTFTDPGLGIEFDYPANFIEVAPNSTSETTRRCATVLLSVQSPESSTGPHASVSLLEFKHDCVSDTEWQNHDRMLASLTKALYNQPGAESIGKPLVYDFGGDLTAQRFHMSAVKQSNNAQESSQPVLQMDIATFVHDRALVWVLQSSDLQEFNRLSQMQVSFDGKRKVPLFPAAIQPGSASPAVSHP